MLVESEGGPSVWSGSGSGGRALSEALGEPLSMGVGSSSRRDEVLERRDWSSMVAVVVVAATGRVRGCVVGVRVRVSVHVHLCNC